MKVRTRPFALGHGARSCFQSDVAVPAGNAVPSFLQRISECRALRRGGTASVEITRDILRLRTKRKVSGLFEKTVYP